MAQILVRIAVADGTAYWYAEQEVCEVVTRAGLRDPGENVAGGGPVEREASASIVIGILIELHSPVVGAKRIGMGFQSKLSPAEPVWLRLSE
jgi:hypothetical protein